MEYFKLLHLAKEPFSNSPDPFFFFGSEQHTGCIQKLEIALRLRRGLNVVTGEVGAGKTTLCRQLLRILSGDPQVSSHLILDPEYGEPHIFLSGIVSLITGHTPDLETPASALKESLKHHLFEKGVEEDKTVVLIVDEGQKLTPACLEILRELLNFETNDHKLLQIVIFAQTEFAETLRKIPNLADRVNLYYRLAPLGFKDSIALIRHRINLAADPETEETLLFSLPALWRIHRLSGGYPRKIIHLCHQCLLAMIIQNRSVAGWRLVGACAKRTLAGNPVHLKPMRIAIAFLLLGICVGIWTYSDSVRHYASLLRDHWAGTGPKILATPNALEGQAAAPNLGKAPLSIPEATAADPPAIAPMPETAPGTSSFSSSFDVGRSMFDVQRSSFHKATQPDSPSPEDPAILGKVPVAVGDTLEGLVRKVYGRFTYRYHQAVLAANPLLTAPDRLTVGEFLVFPAVTADTTDLPDTTWWISIGRESDLEAAVSRLREETESRLPLRILVLWHHTDGLTFQVVLNTCFEDQDSAELERGRVAHRTSKPPAIICLEKGNARIFSYMRK